MTPSSVLFTLSNSLLIPLDFGDVFVGKGASSGVAATGTLGGDVWNAIPKATRIAGRKGFINATLNQIERDVQQVGIPFTQLPLRPVAQAAAHGPPTTMSGGRLSQGDTDLSNKRRPR